jgi:Flp pilus assembly pilin Flp
MNLSRRLWQEEEGQGLTEYTLVVLLVALTFWVAVKQTDLGGVLDKVWGLVSVCVLNPLNCNGS